MVCSCRDIKKANQKPPIVCNGSDRLCMKFSFPEYKSTCTNFESILKTFRSISAINQLNFEQVKITGLNFQPTEKKHQIACKYSDTFCTTLQKKQCNSTPRRTSKRIVERLRGIRQSKQHRTFTNTSFLSFKPDKKYRAD